MSRWSPGTPVPTDERGLYKTRWSTAKAVFIGYLTDLGRTSTEIAEALGDGTHPKTISTLWTRWGLPRRKGTGSVVPVTIPSSSMSRLQRIAAKRGVSPEFYLSKIAVYAIRDDMFDAIVDEDLNAPPRPRMKRGGDRQSAAFRASRDLR